eukprot:CFRG3411T1
MIPAANRVKTFTRHSKLQQDVLTLYRNFLRAIKTKPIENQPVFYQAVRAGFDQHKEESKRDINKIEFLLRSGKKKLKYIQSDDVANIGFVD